MGIETDCKDGEERLTPWVSVAVNRPFFSPLTYRLRTGMERPARGALVAVPLGRGSEIGIVLDFPQNPGCEPGKVREIRSVLGDFAPLPDSILALGEWIARYYACPPGEALAACLPPGMRSGRSRRREYRVELLRRPDAQESAALERRAAAQFRALRTLIEAGGGLSLRDLNRHAGVSASATRALAAKGWIRLVQSEPIEPPAWNGERESPHPPSPEQRSALEPIAAALRAGGYAPFLLFGVTGSGKTEVYLEAIRMALEEGKTAIYLVPEIALTPQTTDRLLRRFAKVAVLHSGLSDRMRDSYWAQIRSGEVRVVVGARSAILAPVPDLGIVIVDEEHESTFKQQATPRYHARDVAVYRAWREGATVVLGSATPSLESWSNALAGKYHLLRLRERIPGSKLPAVHLIDLRHEQIERRGRTVLSSALCSAITAALERGRQVLLLQNRRGYAPVLFCGACGSALTCRRCDVTMTMHRKRNRAVCHMCSEEVPATLLCPECGRDSLVLLGTGSERVEEVLGMAFPRARIRRMDSDTMLSRDAYQEIYEEMSSGAIDILVGTQMVAKGFDFPGVSVVGVIQADTSLCIPDFRSSERTFQLIAQVSGRSGRGAEPGLVYVQSFEPGHDAIRLAALHDYESFATAELEDRRRLGYPPYSRMVRIQLEGAREQAVIAAARRVREQLEAGIAGRPGLRLQGPAPAVVRLVRGRHRRQLLVRAAPAQELAGLRPALAALVRHPGAGVRLDIDVDPVGSW